MERVEEIVQGGEECKGWREMSKVEGDVRSREECKGWR